MAEKETKTVEETKVEKVDINLDEIFDAAPGGDSITLPEDNKPNIFSRTQREVDTSFLDEKVEEPVVEEETEAKTETKEEEVVEQKVEAPKEEINVDEVLGLKDGVEDDNIEEAPKRGRKPIQGMADVFGKLIKDEKIIPFDDEKPIEEYSVKDFEELIQANLDERTRSVRN